MSTRSDTARNSDTPRNTFRRGRTSERSTFLLEARDIAVNTWRSAGRHEIPLFAPAIAYALVIALAPLTLALRFVTASIAETGDIIPGSPLGNTQLTPEKVLGSAPGWAGPLAIVVTVLLVVWGASSLFTQFVRAIHRIWDDEAISGIGGFMRSRALALLLLVVMAVALFASTVLGNALTNFAELVRDAGGSLGDELGWLVGLASRRVILDFIFATVLCTVAFTAVPTEDQRVRDVLPGVLITAAGYALGQQLLGLYLSSSEKIEALGSFGLFVAFLIWAYYTSLILLLGAELSHELSRRRRAQRPLEPRIPDTSSSAVVQ